MAIDLHVHWVPETLAEQLRARRVAPWIERAADGAEWLQMPIGRLAFTESYTDMGARLDFMDGLGVGRQVLSFPGLFGLDSRPAAEALPLLRLYNDETATLCGQHPDRFSGLAALPFDDIAAAVAEYRRARDDLGLIGAILPNNFFLSLDLAARLGPILDVAEEVGGHLFIHPGRRPEQAETMDAVGDAAGATRYADSVMARRQLEIQHQVAEAMVTLIYGDLLDGYANFSIHIANIGGTLALVIERIQETARLRAPGEAPPMHRLRRLYVDSSSMGPRAIEAAVAIYGADRVVLGSDCPIYSTEFSLRALDEARIDAEARAAIRTGNAAAMLAGLLP